jgi:hypothetical protein
MGDDMLVEVRREIVLHQTEDPYYQDTVRLTINQVPISKSIYFDISVDDLKSLADAIARIAK